MVIHRERKQLGQKEKKKGCGQHRETMPLFPTVLPLCHCSKKTIKEDRQNWESNRRLIGARKMSTNFTDQPQGMCSPWWKDAGISVEYISFLSIMASWREWWWHLFSTLFPLKAFACAWKTKVRECVCLNKCISMDVLYTTCQNQHCYWRCRLSGRRQVLAPDLWHLSGHDISIPSS